MVWRKSVFSYVLWLIYTIAVAGGIFYLVCLYTGAAMSVGMAAAVTGGVLVIAGLLVHILYKIAQRAELAGKDRLPGLILEGLLTVMALAVGILLRVQYLDTDQTGSTYFQLAQLVEGQGIPQVVHSAEYLYLLVLRSVCFLFGNYSAPCVWLQMVLQLLALFVLYRAVRRLSGKGAALTLLCYGMISPYLIRESMVLSPEMLYLLLLAAGLYFMAVMLASGKCSPVYALFVGVCTAALLYLDITGVVLVPFALGMFALRTEKAKQFLSRSGMVFLFWLVGAAAGFFAIMEADALSSGKQFINVLEAWARLYQPKAFFPALPVSGMEIFWETVIPAAAAAFGIFSFWCNKEADRKGIWVIVLAVLCAMQIFGIPTASISVLTPALLFLAAIAGVGLADIFAAEKTETEKQPAEGLDDGEWEALNASESLEPAEPLEAIAVADMMPASEQPAKEPKFAKESKPVKEPESVKESKPAKEPEPAKESKPAKEPESVKKSKPVKEPKPEKEKKRKGKKAKIEESEFDYFYEEPIKVESLKKMLAKEEPLAENTVSAVAASSAVSSSAASLTVAAASTAAGTLADAAAAIPVPQKAEQLKRPNYIENPLPLPQKHEPKVMDYSVKEPEAPDDYGYDIVVADDDDFDI